MKFQLVYEEGRWLLLYKPNRNTHFYLELGKHKKADKILPLLLKVQEESLAPIKYSINAHEVNISFDLTKLDIKPEEHEGLSGRWLGIDMNPNWIGLSVCQWSSSTEYKVLWTDVLSFKELNDKTFALNKKHLGSTAKERTYLTNKRSFETEQAAIYCIKVAKHFKCKGIAVEDLNMKKKDLGLSKSHNALCNNLWTKQVFRQTLKKWTYLRGLELQSVNAAYSSTAGNIMFRHLKQPDMLNAAVELSRRAYEFDCQYVEGINPKKKVIVDPNPTLFEGYRMSLEELTVPDGFKKISEIHDYIKKNKDLKSRYRVSLDKIKVKSSSRLFSAKSLVRHISCS